MSTDSEIKQRLTSDMKTAMRAKDSKKLLIIRLIIAEIKRTEIDQQTTLCDTEVITVLDKMRKQRNDSINQFEKANRTDLVDQEKFELEIINEYLPKQLSEAEIDQIISDTIEKTQANSIQQMGTVMSALKPLLQGRADMKYVSIQIKKRLQP